MGATLQLQQAWCVSEEDCCKGQKLRHISRKVSGEADGEQSDRNTERLMERLFDLYDQDGRGSVERELLRGVVERIGAAARGRTPRSQDAAAPELAADGEGCGDPRWCAPDFLELAGGALRGAFDLLPSGASAATSQGGSAAEEAGRRVERAEFRELVQGALRASGESPRSVLQQVVCECYDQSLEALISQLFRVQDLNDDGFLEETELVQLNKKIAMLHYGKDVDKDQVSAKFRTLFRSKLDAEGSPVSLDRFKSHILSELRELDGHDLAAQCSIVEQWLLEAVAARDMFRVPSMQSLSDLPFLLASPLQLSDADGGFDDGLSKVTTPPVAPPRPPRAPPRAPVPSVTSGSTMGSPFSSGISSDRRLPGDESLAAPAVLAS